MPARARNTSDVERALRFESDFVARVERLVLRASAARGRDDGLGRGAASGGAEFERLRPYQPGEDVRDLDWASLARGERPLVRVRRREVGERWAIVLDASASMGVGARSKLQLAGEVAVALAFLALRLGATSELLVASATPLALRVRVAGDLARVLESLDGLVARGAVGAQSTFADPRLARAARVFVMGDQLGYAPRDVLPLARRGRELAIVQVLAPEELAPELGGSVEWRDPESGARLEIALTSAALDAYAARLRAELESWRNICAQHGVAQRCFSSALPFEDVVTAVLA